MWGGMFIFMLLPTGISAWRARCAIQRGYLRGDYQSWNWLGRMIVFL
jgi:hypothetical protein